MHFARNGFVDRGNQALKALVTGISGFAGGYLAQHLLAEGYQVLGTSTDGCWRADTAQELIDQIRLIPWNLREDLPDVSRDQIMRFAPDWIFHLAALSVPSDCGTTVPTEAALAINVAGAGRVVQLCQRLQPAPRLLFVSSSHVYAPVTADCCVVAETAPLGPTNGYGRSKQLAENLVTTASRTGLDAVIVRAFQHTGPRQNSRMMLPEWAEQFAWGKDPVRVQRLDARIDLSDVRDVVRAYRLLAQHGKSGAVYNVGSGTSLRSGNVFDELRRLADPSRPVVELYPGQKQDPIADTTRVARETGWQPTIAWQSTVADVWQYWNERARTTTTVTP